MQLIEAFTSAAAAFRIAPALAKAS
jgi:hypothetical protein